MRRFQTYIKEVIQEMRKVSWPTWDELKGSTAVVLVFSAIMSMFVAGVDFIFAKLVEQFV